MYQKQDDYDEFGEETIMHTEYRPRRKKNRRPMLLCFCVVAVLLAIIIPVAVVTSNRRHGASGRPSPECPSGDERERVDCYPEGGASLSRCEARGCCWDQPATQGPPSCFYPTNHGYELSGGLQRTPLGYRASLHRLNTPSAYGNDRESIEMEVEIQQDYRLHLKLSDPKHPGYEVPEAAVKRPLATTLAEHPLFNLTFTSKPFSIKVTRKSTGATIFDSSVGKLTLSAQFLSVFTRLVTFDSSVGKLTFSAQFLSVSTRLASSNLYGLGEHVHRRYRHDLNWKTWPFFTRDSSPAAGDSANLYGQHPFYMCVEEDGNANGVFVLNSNAMDVTLQPGAPDSAPIVTYRVIGGVLDFYMFLGPTPENVVQQYTERVAMPTVTYRVIGGVLDFYMFLGPSPENVVQQYTERVAMPTVTYRVIGGVLDFYMFLGPSPENVVQQYTEVIGRPMMPAYWGLGFQLSKWFYNNSQGLREVILRTRTTGIPYDVQYSDIDYMEDRKDFTYDGNNYGDLPDVIRDLHNNGQKYIVILDPAVSTQKRRDGSPYVPYEMGRSAGVFVNTSDGKTPIVGQKQQAQKEEKKSAVTDHVARNSCVRDWEGARVIDREDNRRIRWIKEAVWIRKSTPVMNRDEGGYKLSHVWPSDSVFPDFTNPSGVQWWADNCRDLHNNISFDGLWIDMNEPSNFLNGSLSGCATNTRNHPPYLPGNAMRSILPSKRGVVLTRSSFAGTGQFASHWLGDNKAAWEDMAWSIPGILEFGLFGIPHIGADICGFGGNTTEELCQRWMQLGAFYPFSRNHNTMDGNPSRGSDFPPAFGRLAIRLAPQDPAVFSQAMIDSTRDVMMTRYTLLPYLYTLFYHAHVTGATVVRPLLHEDKCRPSSSDLSSTSMHNSPTPILNGNGKGKAKHLNCTDTGKANHLTCTDTGKAKHLTCTDTGKAKHLTCTDTGKAKHLTCTDTGKARHLPCTDTGKAKHLTCTDTGKAKHLTCTDTDKAKHVTCTDTGKVKHLTCTDTGKAKHLTCTDTGKAKHLTSTDTGEAKHLTCTDTGKAKHITCTDTCKAKHLTCTDTGKAKHITCTDTCKAKHLTCTDTGIAKHLTCTDTGKAKHLTCTDTGKAKHLTCTDTEVEGQYRGQTVTLDAPLNKINVHVRGGTILPTQQPANTTVYSRRNPMGLVVALNDSDSAGASGSLFWDDGESYDSIEKSNFLQVTFTASASDGIRCAVDALPVPVPSPPHWALLPYDKVDVLGLDLPDVPTVKAGRPGDLRDVDSGNVQYDRDNKVLRLANLVDMDLWVYSDLQITWT
ncbi:hypothetical protein Bbelb_271010 [Branchiostoma belcheri]|nr:hypothetical protein Bbelb_271010 [Branchiostoma belcheri]